MGCAPPEYESCRRGNAGDQYGVRQGEGVFGEEGNTIMQYPTTSTFLAKLEHCWQQDNLVCVGLDADYDQLPSIIKTHQSVEDAMFHFNREIIDATHDLVC